MHGIPVAAKKRAGIASPFEVKQVIPQFRISRERCTPNQVRGYIFWSLVVVRWDNALDASE